MILNRRKHRLPFSDHGFAKHGEQLVALGGGHQHPKYRGGDSGRAEQRRDRYSRQHGGERRGTGRERKAERSAQPRRHLMQQQRQFDLQLLRREMRLQAGLDALDQILALPGEIGCLKGFVPETFPERIAQFLPHVFQVALEQIDRVPDLLAERLAQPHFDLVADPVLPLRAVKNQSHRGEDGKPLLQQFLAAFLRGLARLRQRPERAADAAQRLLLPVFELVLERREPVVVFF